MVVRSFGGPDVLRVEDVPVPRLAPGEVLVEVKFADVNYVDRLDRRGHSHRGLPVPFIPGLAVVGVVVRLAPGVTGPAVGDVVVAYPQTGGYAEYVAVTASCTFTLPPGLDRADLVACAAGFTVVATALAALRALPARVACSDEAGATVLIHGASGSLATVTAQLARHHGARRVYGTSRVQQAAPRSASFDDVMVQLAFPDRMRELVGDRGVDLVVDTVGGNVLRQTWDLVAAAGHVVLVGNASEQSVDLQLPGDLQMRSIGVSSFSLGVLARRAPIYFRHLGDRSVEAIVDHHLDIPIASVRPLAAAAQAHAEIESGSVHGKVLLEVP